MGFSKKPFCGGVGANSVHVSHTQIVRSAPAEARSKSNSFYIYGKNTVLTVIAFLMLTMVGYTIFNFIATPEFLVKHKISSIADDYYQNYFYNSVPDKEGLSYYIDTGLSRLSLRQLLLYSDHKYGESTDYFSTYCNLDSTSIKFYPEEPYERKSYHTDYTYSCKF